MSIAAIEGWSIFSRQNLNFKLYTCNCERLRLGSFIIGVFGSEMLETSIFPVMLKRGGKQSRQWHGSQNQQLTALVTFLVLALVVSIYFFWKEGKPSSSFRLLEQKVNGFPVELHPNVDYRNGTDVIWQVPESPKAVLFLAHGCSGRAANFWDSSPECPKCVGLPEERLIVLNALARRFAVITVSSAGKCWSLGEERLIVKGIIKWWVKKTKLEHLPRVALGASSGGYFVSVLARDMRFSSIVLMIAEGVFDEMDVPKDYPPTLFVHMPKDRFRKHKINDNIEMLREKGIDAAEVKCVAFPLSPKFLADRVPSLDESVAVKLYNLFLINGFIDKNGYMKSDGRAIHWKQALRRSRILLPDKNLLNHIQEEMNLAFSYHEMTSLQSEQIFNWFESHLR